MQKIIFSRYQKTMCFARTLPSLARTVPCLARAAPACTYRAQVDLQPRGTMRARQLVWTDGI